ncbi:MarR family winged helix-turn-helix transcriptional regulator [Chloroflexota bacterium]
MKEKEHSNKSKYKLIDVHTEDDILNVFVLFVQTAQIILKYGNAFLYRKARLSVVKLIVLQVLSTMGGAMTMTEIARLTLSEPHNITTLIKRLKRDGLIITEQNKADKRLVNVTLTNKGQRVLKHCMPAAREVISQVMSSISKRNAVLLEKQCAIMRHNVHHNLEDIYRHSQP